MIILRKPSDEFRRVELAPGAGLTLRPATTIDFEAAKAAFAAASKAAADTAAFAASYGLPFEARAEESASALAGLHQVVFWTEVAFLCSGEIYGFGDAAGNPLPLERGTIALIMLNSGWQMQIVAELSRALHELRAEGNASAASSPGEPGAAINTAPIAPETASPAPMADASMEASAPSSSTLP